MNRRDQRIFAMLFLAPALVLFTLFVTLPSLRAFAYSLERWDGLSTPRWVGLQNFTTLLRDRDVFIRALGHNIFITAAAGVLILTLSLLFASVLHRRVRGANLFRVAFFFPNVISSVAVALLWLLLYSATDIGVINGALSLLQQWTGWPRTELPIPFMGKQNLIYSLVPMIVWTATGFYMVLFLAAMEGIPETYYEAAKLDGASAPSQFLHITLPLIREVLTVGLVFLVIGCLKLFDVVWIMDNEWPTKETHVLATLMYQKVFSEYNVGYGAAVAVLMFALVFVATLFTLRLSRKEALEY
ncbi:MAG: ABC transporter permease [Candidatus Hydrogenedentota bacterium]